MTDELKPCPFCGGAGKIKGWNGTAIYVRCCLCGCRSGSRRDIMKAINAWNKRAERTCKFLSQGDSFMKVLTCSSCGDSFSEFADCADEYNYCPNCGAKIVDADDR